MIGIIGADKLSDLQRIAFRIRHMGEDMIEEGLTGYGHSLLQFADWIEEVIW